MPSAHLRGGKLRTTLLVVGLALMTVSRVGAADSVPTLADYSVTTWTNKDGLPSTNTFAIAQDRDGYLWLGTNLGLIRFDGVRFVRWQGQPSLPETGVRALCAARDGSLWVGFGYSGGWVGRKREGRWTTYSSRDGLPGGYVIALLEDREGTLWAGGYGGLSGFRNGRWEPVRPEHGLPVQTIQSLYEDRRGNLWVGGAAGVFRRVAGRNTFERFGSSSYPVLSFSEDRAGSLWITDPQEIFRPLEGASRSGSAAAGSKGATGTRLLRDRHGNLWVATRGQGVFRVHLGANGAQRIERLTQREGLRSNNAQFLFEDREGNVWVATQGGLSRLSESSVTTVVGGRHLDGEFFQSVATTKDGSVWIGTADGVDRFSRGKWKRYSESNGRPIGFVTALHSDESGTLWIAADRGLVRFAEGRFSAVPLPEGTPLNRIWAMTTDPDGGLWLCDFVMGLFHWKAGKLTAFGSTWGSQPAYSALTDSGGRVWIGLIDGGLVTYQDGRFTSYSVRDGLAAGNVNALYEDRAGTIWVGTNTGLSRFKDGRFVTPTRISFPDGRVSGIVEDDNGYLWLGVGAGLLRFEGGEFDKLAAQPTYRMQYRLYETSEGLQGTPTRAGHPSVARTADGTLWFLTDRGIAVVDPRRLREARWVPRAHIESVTADDRTFDPAAHLRLDSLTSKIQIDYTALSLGPAGIQFRYKLEGFDADWVDAGKRRQAFYTNLPPGSYRFRVAASRDDLWNESSALWDFSVRPMFHQTWWFFAGCVMTLVFGVWVAWQLRLRRFRTEFALVLAERTRMAREIHDTLLQGLVGVAFQFDAASAQLGSSPKLAKERFGRIRRQMEQYIDEARQSIWDLRSSTVETRDLPTALREAGERITAGTAVHFTLVVTGQPRRCSPTVEEQILRIAREALTNAVRHAQATKIQMELCFDDVSVRLRISDNGRGFDVHSGSATSWGLMSMRERAQRIGGRLAFVSAPDQGTELELVVSFSSTT